MSGQPGEERPRPRILKRSFCENRGGLNSADAEPREQEGVMGPTQRTEGLVTSAGQFLAIGSKILR